MVGFDRSGISASSNIMEKGFEWFRSPGILWRAARTAEVSSDPGVVAADAYSARCIMITSSSLVCGRMRSLRFRV